MPPNLPINYKTETNRYRYYFLELNRLYQKPVTQVSIFVLFTIVSIIFFAVFAIRPTLLTIAELLKKIEDQRSVLSLAEKKSAALTTAQQQLDMLEPNQEALFKAVPDNYQIQELLKSVEAVAGELSIPFKNLKIDQIEYPPSKPDNNIREIKFNIGLQATYPQIKAFMSKLQQLPRLVTVDSLTITSPEKTASGTKAEDEKTPIEATLTCRVYYLNRETSK